MADVDGDEGYGIDFEVGGRFRSGRYYTLFQLCT